MPDRWRALYGEATTMVVVGAVFTLIFALMVHAALTRKPREQGG